MTDDNYEQQRAVHMSAHVLIQLHRGKTVAEAMERSPDTGAFAIGRAAHTIILEPDQFGRRYCIGGPVNPKTGKCYQASSKKFRDWAAKEELEGITSDDASMLLCMRDAIESHAAASQLLAFGVAEQTIRCEYMGFPSQSRLDWICQHGIVDVKTTIDIVGFPYDIEKYGYHYQAAYYQAVADDDPKPYYLIAVQKSSPSQCLVIRLSQHKLDEARRENEAKLKSVRSEFFTYLEEMKCQKLEQSSTA